MELKLPLLPYFHSSIGCLTGDGEIDLITVKSKSQAVAAGFTARQFEDSKVAEFALRTCCCVDPVFQSIYDRNLFIHKGWSALD